MIVLLIPIPIPQFKTLCARDSTLVVDIQITTIGAFNHLPDRSMGVMPYELQAIGPLQFIDGNDNIILISWSTAAKVVQMYVAVVFSLILIIQIFMKNIQGTSNNINATLDPQKKDIQSLKYPIYIIPNKNYNRNQNQILCFGGIRTFTK